MAPKNIIVCADGTGNKGGYSPDSNVYKVYNAVDKNLSGQCNDGVEVSEQIIFYDNGVGTETNKYLRALGGAIGFGFARNVCDLYKFLARNYVPGDRIFFFGFSRGASTVRACNGMIYKCGLAKGVGLRNRELDDLIDEAFAAYKCHKTNPAKADNFKSSERSYRDVPIQFLGVWDTVVALGFPKRTDVTGPLTFVLNVLFFLFEEILNIFWPHKFYHYKLTDNVINAYQALAIDDERTAFWPYVWNEGNIEGVQDLSKCNVEQVWFAGMHSNVGGGYERAGMAAIPLYWMALRAQEHGLMFETGSLQDIYNSTHIHGRMYNSRDGFGFFYRYHPREIENLCKKKLQAKIRIHRSVMERMNHRTANYAPGYIPESFDVVDSTIPATVTQFNPGENPKWENTRRAIDKLVLWRKRLYGVMLAFVLSVIGYTCYLWMTLPQVSNRDGIRGDIADILDYVTPKLFEGLIEVTVVQKPYLFITAIILLVLHFKVRRSLYKKTVDESETLRHYIIKKIEKLDKQSIDQVADG